MILHATSVALIDKVSREFNASLDLDEVLGKVLQLTVEATGATRGSLFLLDKTGKVTYRIVAYPNQAPIISDPNIQKMMTDGLAGWVYRQGHGALAADATTDERWIKSTVDPEVTGSALVVPLLNQEHVIGLLALHHKQVNFFDESHLSLATNIAEQAAIAIANARSFTQLKSEHGTLYALINNLSIPILVIDDKERITFANQNARQLLALKQMDVPLKTVAGGDQLKLALESFWQRVDERKVEVTWPDNRIFNLFINEVPQLGTIITLEDITYFKELDAMKSLFVETVSHDLKSPLSVIHGFATLLKMENLSGRGQNNLAGILLGVEQMRVLIENLLDLARIEAGVDGEVEPCDLVEIVENVLANFKLQIEDKKITLTTDLPAGLPEISANPLRLSQVVANFVSNAIKYTARGGRIAISLSRKDPEICLSVSDNGPGIPPAAQSKLFQKFYRAPDDYGSEWVEGTGLGLSIVKAIVEGYGGRVWVQSEVGAGSTFGCMLPIATPDVADGSQS